METGSNLTVIVSGILFFFMNFLFNEENENNRYEPEFSFSSYSQGLM